MQLNSRKLTATRGSGERDCGQTDPCSGLSFATLKRMPVRQVDSDNMRISPPCTHNCPESMAAKLTSELCLLTLWFLFVVVKIHDQFRKRDTTIFKCTKKFCN
jgi:hypothetical protein